MTFHEYADPSLARFWALAYASGDGEHTNALVAREDADDFDGFWTDDPEQTDRVLQALRSE